MKAFKSQIILPLFSFFFFSQLILAQQGSVKWGEVPKSDLEMKSYPKDTSASALVLYDHGESHLDNDADIVFNRHLRVKIFNTKGYSWGTHSLTLYTNKSTEKISDIEGYTYNLDENGNVTRKEFDDDEVFKEKVDDNHTRYKFTLPLLKPGCVIEIKYTITATSLWFIKDWEFQYDEPVRWSEYVVRMPVQINYVRVSIGFEPYEINDLKETTQSFNGEAVNILGLGYSPAYGKCMEMRLAVKDLPALRDEPFITTKDDYRNKVMLQLAGYSLAGSGVKRVLYDWPKLVNELVDSKSFGQRIEETSKIKAKAQFLTAGLNNQKDKIKAIYDWVTKSIVWDERNDLFAEQDGNDMLKSAKGNNAEITFLFLSLLKSIGINGDPVILSTRGNGKIIDQYPLVTQFNYLLARIKTDSGFLYVDATNPLRPMELLPLNVLNTRGLVIKEDSVTWARFYSPKVHTNNSAALISINTDGSIAGTIEDKLSDYSALFGRQSLKNKKESVFAKDNFETEQSGINIDSVLITNRDSINLPLKVFCKISSSTYAQTNGDLIYINPHIINRLRNNPFKSEERKFPIDYSYKRKQTTIVIITLPPGYEIKELISNKSFNAANGVISFERSVFTDSNKIRINYTSLINDVEIKPAFYKNVKQFYEQMIAAESDQLVLAPKKKIEPALKVAPVVQKEEPKPADKPKKGKKQK
jgi:hypothetical protein